MRATVLQSMRRLYPLKSLRLRKSLRKRLRKSPRQSRRKSRRKSPHKIRHKIPHSRLPQHLRESPLRRKRRRRGMSQ